MSATSLHLASLLLRLLLSVRCLKLILFFNMAQDPNPPKKPFYLDSKSIFFQSMVASTTVANEMVLDDEDTECKKFELKPGRGNAMNGQRNEYHLYQPSQAFLDLSIKADVWHHHVPFQPNDFIDICNETLPLWILPRKGGNQIRDRKHGIDASLIGSISTLRTGNAYLSTESVVKIDNALICTDFKRNLQLLCEVLEGEMQWPSANERLILCGFDDYFNSPVMLDCTDCKLMQSHKKEWADMCYSWKCKQGYRNMVVCDNKGEIRACASAPAGWNNDQFILRCCHFFQHGSLSPGEHALGDGAFHGNLDFPMHTPFTRPQVQATPWLEPYNKCLAERRQLIERINGILKAEFQILSKPFRWDKSLFPLVFRVCCLLLNRMFRLYGYPVAK